MRSQFISSPVLLDRALQPLQAELTKLDWLDHVYGQAEIREREDEERKVLFSVYGGDRIGGARQYVPLTPSPDLGNFSFFYARERKNKGLSSGLSTSQAMRTAEVSLIALWNFDKVFDSNGDRWHTHDHVVNILEQALLAAGSRAVEVVVEGSEIRPREVWKPATLIKGETQRLERPCGTCRIDIKLRYYPSRMSCDDSTRNGIGYDTLGLDNDVQ